MKRRRLRADAKIVVDSSTARTCSRTPLINYAAVGRAGCSNARRSGVGTSKRVDRIHPSTTINRETDVTRLIPCIRQGNPDIVGFVPLDLPVEQQLSWDIQ
jgi:hypothetical protein